MSRPRTPIAQLELAGSPNLKRSLKYAKDAAEKSPLLKKEEMLRMFEEVAARRDEALADVKKNGLMIFEDSFHREKLYQKKVVNPALKIVERCEASLVTIARLLSSGETSGEDKGDGLEEFADIFERHHVA